MGLFGKKKNDDEVGVIFNTIGEAIHIFDDGTAIKKLNAADFLRTGKQFCKDCHCEMKHKTDYWECPTCGDTIDDEDVEESGGYPTLNSTYEDDFGYFGDTDDDDEDDDW